MRRKACLYQWVVCRPPLSLPSQRTAVYGLRQRLGSPSGLM